MTRFLSLLFILLLGGCTVAGGTNDRFQRTGFPGVFDPGATVILDTVTGAVYVGFSGSYAEAALDSAASGLLMPATAITVSGTSSQTTTVDGGDSHSNHGHGHGNGGPR